MHRAKASAGWGVIGVSLRAALTEQWLAPAALIAAGTLLPTIGPPLTAFAVGGYMVVYQRRVRAGRRGLPPLRDAPGWLRFSLGYLLLSTPIYLGLYLLLAGITVLPFREPILQFVSPTALTFLVSWPFNVIAQIAAMRYASLGSIRSGLEYGRAVGVMRGRWRRFLPALVWMTVSWAGLLILERISSPPLTSVVANPGQAVGALLAQSNTLNWLSLAAAAALAVVSFLNGLVIAQLVARYSSGPYPASLGGPGAVQDGTLDL